MTPIEPQDLGVRLYANRRSQLRALIDQHTAGNIANFADQFGYSRSRVSQFLSETYNDGRSIGERAARAMEEAAGLPFGWLDGEAAATASADQALRARMLQLAGAVAAAKDQAARANAECDRLRDSDNQARQELGAELARNYQLEQQVLTLFGTAGAPVDHGAELRRAISETRIVFESEPAAGEALNYLEAVLTAGAPVPAQTGISAADQAAAALAAESAQLVAQAEKAAAGAAARAAVDPLAVLSRELFSLSEKLQQPVDLVVQLMVLRELRALPRLDV